MKTEYCYGEMPSAARKIVDEKRHDAQFADRAIYEAWIEEKTALFERLFFDRWAKRINTSDSRINSLDATDLQVMVQIQNRVGGGKHWSASKFGNCELGEMYALQDSFDFEVVRVTDATTDPVQLRMQPTGFAATYVLANPGSVFAPVGWPAVNAAKFNTLHSAFEDAILRYARIHVLDLKAAFQRPRPHQAAIRVTSKPPISIEPTWRGQHPALPAGHAEQAIIGAVHAIYDGQFPELSRSGIEHGHFVAWCSTASDLRVLAGIHFPSDVLAAWLIAIDVVRSTIKKHLVDDALELVAQIIAATQCWRFCSQPSQALYAPILNEIRDQLSNPRILVQQRHSLSGKFHANGAP